MIGNEFVKNPKTSQINLTGPERVFLDVVGEHVRRQE
jgi:hypothetical protein